MGNAGEISVDLRLSLDKLTGDIARAAQQVKSGLSARVSGGGSSSGSSSGGIGNIAGGGTSPTGSAGGSGPPPIPGTPGIKPPSGGINTIMPSGFRSFISLARTVSYLTGGLISLGFVVKEITKSFELANKLYVSSLRSGLGAQFSVRQSLISGVLGVSEKELYNFGAAMAFVEQKTRFATAALTETMPQLAATEIRFKAMLLDIRGAISEIIDAFTPLINSIIGMAAEIAQFVETHPKLFKAAADAFFPLINLLNILATKFGPGREKVPTAPTSIDRLPASAWEKMGLVVGSSTGTNYAQKTAENTARIAKTLDHIAQIQNGTSPSVGVAKPTSAIPRGGSPVIGPNTNSP